MRPSWKAGRGVWVCLPLVKISKPVVLHIDEEALWLLLFYSFMCTFLLPLAVFQIISSLCRLSPFNLSYAVVSLPHRLREFSLKESFPKGGLLILIS